MYFSHKRKIINCDGIILGHADFMKTTEEPIEMEIRFRTIGDITCTGAIISKAKNVEEIINEIKASRIGERGARADDKKSESSMEERKRNGYF